MASHLPVGFVDEVAKCCHDHYLSLPKTGKPKLRFEWTAISAVVMEITENKHEGSHLEVVSLGTGSKCLGHSAMSPKGDVLNDSHAEVMARRGFLRYLYRELLSFFRGEQSCVVSSPGSDGKCRIRNGIKFHFYTSHTPCGDASIIPKGTAGDDSVGMPLVKNGVDHHSHPDSSVVVAEEENCGVIGDLKKVSDSPGDGTHIKLMETGEVNFPEGLYQGNPTQATVETVPAGSKRKCSETEIGEILFKKQRRFPAYDTKDIHRTGAKCVPQSGTGDPHLPGVLYHVLGEIRYKPGRGEQTHSLSCSDKLARWCSVGMEGALLSHFFTYPIRISSIVVGGGCPYSLEAMRRAIIERVQIPSEEILRVIRQPPLIFQSSLPFLHGRYSEGEMMVQLVPCPSSIVWSKVGKGALEVAVNGRKQGVTQKTLGTPAGRLKICKRELLNLFFEVFEAKNSTGRYLCGGRNISKDMTYFDLKSLAQGYYRAWESICQSSFPSWPTKCKSLVEFKLSS